MPTILVQLAYLVIFIWSIVMIVQDIQLSRKSLLNILLHIAIAIVSLNWFLHSIGYQF
ncbi:hypothetical protein [Paenibacillus sp. Marseille-Q4541]|uniref:hypothetical protein n=1 Tax=Paenibacillus sp. Marseille-Q4541 TaxID=2831522 RepID=UPI001BA528A1|nr:hypothetical protein [Paenibacillus sp. Marseille-Q4541]